MSNPLEVRLLGEFEISNDDKSVTITSRPAQTLFAYLILNAGTAHRREKLAGMLWPDSLEQTARENLRHALWRLRKALESVSAARFLQADDLMIKFEDSSDYWLDAAQLEKLNENASADELIVVLSNYQGELLPGFYDEWAISEREHFYSIFEHQMARLMSLLESENRWLDVLDWAERWIKLGQKPEPAYRALMSAHAAKGDMSKVAATYGRCVKSLKEIGITPSEQTRALYEILKSGKETPKVSTVTMKVPAKETVSNIPVPLTSFVGREKELKEIARQLSSSRLLTLTGPGGVGKTRLAIQTANDSFKKFKDGVCWVGLVGLSDETLIPQEIAQSLNLREVANEPLIGTLKAFLKSKEILLVIDNCEHLIGACAQYVEQLLAACPKLKIMATSIEALGLFNEVTWQVPSLPLPETRSQSSLSLEELEEFASIQLFDQRASIVKSGFVLDERNVFFIAQICHRLDGIPLAIELAAARIKVLSVDEIAARLDDRFSLLTAGSRTAIPRHQTLRATIDWSYDLLTEPERILLSRLSVFAGGFALEAAEAVCSHEELKPRNILDLLGRLVDKSLVIVDADSEIHGTRYRLLETIRQYALEKLTGSGEAREIRDRHLEFFVKFAQQAEPKIFGSESAIWLGQLDKELDNIRAAIEWSTNSGKAVMALQILGSLVYFWFAHGLGGSEWQDRVQHAMSRSEGKGRTLERAKALNGMGLMYWADLYPVSRPSEFKEALSIGKELGDPWSIATAFRNLGLIENIQGNYQEARLLLEQGLEIWRNMGSAGKMEYTWTLNILGDVAFNQNNFDEARSIFEENVAVLRQLEDKNFLAYAVRRLGLLAWQNKNSAKAISLYKESMMLNQEVGDLRGVLACVAGFASIANTQKKFERGARLMAAVENHLDLIGMRLLTLDKTEYQRNLVLLREQMDEQTLSKCWAKGKEMSLEEAIAFVLEDA